MRGRQREQRRLRNSMNNQVRILLLLAKSLSMMLKSKLNYSLKRQIKCLNLVKNLEEEELLVKTMGKW